MEFIMTVAAVVFTLMPIIIMAMWLGQFIDFGGAGSLAYEVSYALFGAKGQ